MDEKTAKEFDKVLNAFHGVHDRFDKIDDKLDEIESKLGRAANFFIDIDKRLEKVQS